MNKKLNPLTENHLFSKAYKNGICDVNKLCAVYVLKNIRKNKDGTPLKTKLGIAVNAKLGGAVQRNRVKRIIREACYPLFDNISDGLIIVIAARGAAFSHSAKSTGISKCLENSFNNLGVFKGQLLKTKQTNQRKNKNSNFVKS